MEIDLEIFPCPFIQSLALQLKKETQSLFISSRIFDTRSKIIFVIEISLTLTLNFSVKLDIFMYFEPDNWLNSYNKASF